MIRRTRGIFLIVLILSMSCAGRTSDGLIVAKTKNTQNEVVDDSEQLNFVFYKSFQLCNSAYAAYSDEEANEIFAEKQISLENAQIKSGEDCDSRFYDGALDCIEMELNQKHTKSIVYSLEDDFPFDEVLVFNDQFLITSQDGYFFVFERLDSKMSLPEKVDEKVSPKHQIASKKTIEALSTTKNIQLPLEYSYDFVVGLTEFTSVNEIKQLTKLDHLYDTKCAKLRSSSTSNILLVSGVMESGQSEMFLLTLNDAFEVVDSLKLYSFKETEEGGILTRFKINKDYTILVIEEEKGGSNDRIISQKKWQISEKGDFHKID